jgi:alanine dehydrogenase
MIVGVPKEIKANENRIALVPAGAEALVAAGHEVIVEAGGGEGSNFPDEQYEAVGAKIEPDVEALWERAEMIMKVKEPIQAEYPRMRPGQVLFTYFHFAADEVLTRKTLERKVVAIAYETVQLPTGELPLLTPMSEVAGRMAVQEGAKYLEKAHGGLGLLLGGVPGVLPAEVVILGGGVVGTNAAKIAAGFGAHVTILDVNLDRLRYLADVMPANVDTYYSNRHNILEQISRADLLIGAVLLPGAKAPSLVKKEDLALMKDGSVLVDVAVDQGGCIETVRPTTHADPIYVVDGVIHYCVANMPGAVPRTSTLALTNATFPYAMKLANKGWEKACREDRSLALGVNAVDGQLTYEAVAEAFGFDSVPLSDVL